MLVPKKSMRLISAREKVGKDSGKKLIGLISINHYRCSETAVVYPRQNTSRKESLKYTESAKPIGAARRSLLEQRATGELSTPRPIGAARKSVRNLLEQRAGKDLSTEKPIGVARRTYWSSAQVGLNLLEQRASSFRKCLILLII